MRATERIKLLFQFRELLRLLIVQNLALRYRRTVLGFFWSLLSPLATMAILAVVFHFVIRIEMASYTVFLLSSMLPWSFFALTLTESSVSILHKHDLISRQPIPKLLLPLSTAGSNLLNFALSFLVLLGILGPALGFNPSWAWLYLPLGCICLFAFSIGLGAIAAVSTVYLRDVQQIVIVVLPAWMYATPILYPLEMPGGGSIVPVEYQDYFKLNPIYSILQLFVRPIYWGRAPELADVVNAILISSVVLVCGLTFFWWKEDELIFHL